MPIAPLYFTPGTVKAKFYKSTLTPSTSHEFRSDIDSEASTGTNVDVKTVTDTTTYSYPFVTIDFGDLSWTNLTSSDIRYVYFYEDTGSASTDRLICWHDLGATQTPINATCNVQFNAAGVIRIDIQ